MRRAFLAISALLVTGLAVGQKADRPSPLDPQAKAPPAEFRSTFEGYRPFADQELRDWRKANDEVRQAGGHAGQKPGQGSGQPSSKPQAGSPDSSRHQGHGAHK